MADCCTVLCAVCRSIFSHSHDVCSEDDGWCGSNAFDHHRSVKAVKYARQSGCFICYLLLQKIETLTPDEMYCADFRARIVLCFTRPKIIISYKSVCTTG